MAPTRTCLSTDDRARWRSLLPAGANVFGSAEFTALIARLRGWEGRLFVVGDGEGCLSYPFLVRKISDLPFASKTGLYDTVSPDYTGPIPSGHVSDSLNRRFLSEFGDYCREKGIVSEFVHLHPWQAATAALEPASVQFNRELIYVDATISDEELWKQHFDHACRKNINRSNREGLRILQVADRDQLKRFCEIYTGIMRRRDAAASYYFPLEFFVSIFEDLGANARFTLAEHQGRIVGGILYLCDGDNVYSYLGGADYEFQHLRPTNAIVYDTIQWARRTGRKRVVLGAGYRPDDGIERFKATFSRLRASFYTYKRVHDPLLYETLCRNAGLPTGVKNSDQWSYFPAYRSPNASAAARPPAAVAEDAALAG